MHTPTRERFPLAVTTLPATSFLTDVRVYDVDESGQLAFATQAAIEQLALASVQSRCAEISDDAAVTLEDSAAAIAIPTIRNDRVVSVAVLSSKSIRPDHDDVVGVFEVWKPVGEFEELALSKGYFGRMERFQNVSSFVRFEKGTGLPGQVWQKRTSVIHDDLSNHPGFLRAAGASAELLATAIGLPVAGTDFQGTALLISSTVSPLARAFEVWQAEENGFRLLDASYAGFEEELVLLPDTEWPLDSGLPGLAAESGTAVLSEEPTVLYAGRNHETKLPDSGTGLAIPFFEGDKLTSVTTLLF